MSASETPSGYQDIAEKGFIKWCLDYGFEPIIRCFLSIPEARLYSRMGELNPAIWIFGHIAVNEEKLMRRFARDIRELTCPYPCTMFEGSATTSEQQLREIEISREELVEYWRKVRADTHAFLESLTGHQLAAPAEKSTVPADAPNRGNPIREFFIMAIQNQYIHYGHLDAISRLDTIAG
jgi:hypothetical protein